MLDFLKALVGFFETYKVDYMLSGSVAMSLYVEPRFTRDYDFVVHLKEDKINDLILYFKDGYYCSEEAVRDAVKRKSMFNIIDHKSNYKTDFVILKDEPFRQTEFQRRNLVKFLDMNIYVVSPEDLILSKLIWIQDLQSSQQIDDIKLLSELKNLDKAYVNHWVKEMQLKTFNLL